MEYEYGSGQQGLNYPNPYRIENIFLGVRTGVFALSALVLLFLAKSDLNQENYWGLIINMIGVCAFVYGCIKTGYQMSQQLRVYFGRGQPSNLAPDFGPTSSGYSKESEQLRETIRQGAISVRAPSGNLHGLLYSKIKNLIIAPYEIQVLAQRTFSNLIKIVILFSLFVLSIFFAGSGSGAASGWLGLYFFITTCVLILAPLISTRQTKVALDAQTFWVLLGCSVIIPILLFGARNSLPLVTQWNFGWQSFFILSVTLFGEVISMLALKSQLITPTGLTTSFEQEAVSFNAPPSQINAEIERRLQSQWSAGIPNRVYARVLPMHLTGESGTFQGHLIQETQPLAPSANSEPQTLKSVRENPRFQYLFLLDTMALAASIIASLGLLTLLYQFHASPTQNYAALYWTPFLLALMFLGAHWINIGHGLWGRFDFESKLYVLEYEGSYSMAQMNFGNQLKDSLQTRKQIVNVETMTLRVWVTHLNTVVFGHGIDSEQRPRRLINMLGLKSESKALLSHLKEFIENQSMILKPNSKEDVSRVSMLSQLNQMAEGDPETAEQARRLKQSESQFLAGAGQQLTHDDNSTGGDDHKGNKT